MLVGAEGAIKRRPERQLEINSGQDRDTAAHRAAMRDVHKMTDRPQFSKKVLFFFAMKIRPVGKAELSEN